MSRSIRSLVSVVAAVACMWPVAASAQVRQLPQVSPDVPNVEQVRHAFSAAGYTVDDAHTWDWTSPAFSSFQVHDTARDRVLMVLVYPSIAAAETAQREAASHERSLNGDSLDNTDTTPHLVIGYGPSAWNGNVALVETTGSVLRGLYQAQLDQDNDISVDADLVRESTQPGLAVDLDFQQALENGVVNL